MIALSMPGFFEWIIILVMLAAIIGGVLAVVRGVQRPRDTRGFDVKRLDDHDHDHDHERR